VAYAIILWVGAVLLISWGWQQGKHLWPPVLHLVYMLPLPGVIYYKVSTSLQVFSSELGVWMLQLLSVPVFLEDKVLKPKHSAFKAYEPGYIHIDVKYLPQMQDETKRRYLFVAIDRATRRVFIHIFSAKSAANARRFLRDLERACSLKIRTILTDNGKKFTDRLFGLRKRAATGKHEFDKVCAELEIEHRLTPPKSPQTNGMVERFNGRIEDVLQGHHFRSGEDLEQTLLRYVWLYNQQLTQSVLGSRTP
jgi:transposase InsO family protein